MDLLLDTNALLWALVIPERMRAEARETVRAPRNRVYVSAVSVLEICIKIALGKLAAPPNVGTWLPGALRENSFTPLSVSHEHAQGVEHLPRHHGDPFDRLLIAQAIAERLTIVTSDAMITRYAVPTIRC